MNRKEKLSISLITQLIQLTVECTLDSTTRYLWIPLYFSAKNIFFGLHLIFYKPRKYVKLYVYTQESRGFFPSSVKWHLVADHEDEWKQELHGILQSFYDTHAPGLAIPDLTTFVGQRGGIRKNDSADRATIMKIVRSAEKATVEKAMS